MILASKPGKGSKGLSRRQRPSHRPGGCWSGSTTTQVPARSILQQTATRTVEKGTGTGQNTQCGLEVPQDKASEEGGLGESSRKAPGPQGQDLSASLRVLLVCCDFHYTAHRVCVRFRTMYLGKTSSVQLHGAT